MLFQIETQLEEEQASEAASDDCHMIVDDGKVVC